MILWLVHITLYTILISITIAFIIIFSCSLVYAFVSKLVQVYKGMDYDINIRHKGWKRENILNNKLLSTITKSSILAIVSLSATVLSLIIIVSGYFSIGHLHNEAICELVSSIHAFITLGDVYTNYLCVLVSYNCFHKAYVSICSKCDNKCKICCIKKLAKKRRIRLTNDSGTITPVDGGGECTHVSTFKFIESGEDISVDEDIKINKYGYQKVDINEDDDSVTKTYR
eukprot:187476_1